MTNTGKVARLVQWLDHQNRGSAPKPSADLPTRQVNHTVRPLDSRILSFFANLQNELQNHRHVRRRVSQTLQSSSSATSTATSTATASQTRTVHRGQTDGAKTHRPSSVLRKSINPDTALYNYMKSQNLFNAPDKSLDKYDVSREENKYDVSREENGIYSEISKKARSEAFTKRPHRVQFADQPEHTRKPANFSKWSFSQNPTRLLNRKMKLARHNLLEEIRLRNGYHKSLYNQACQILLVANRSPSAQCVQDF